MSAPVIQPAKDFISYEMHVKCKPGKYDDVKFGLLYFTQQGIVKKLYVNAAIVTPDEDSIYFVVTMSAKNRPDNAIRLLKRQMDSACCGADLQLLKECAEVGDPKIFSKYSQKRLGWYSHEDIAEAVERLHKA